MNNMLNSVMTPAQGNPQCWKASLKLFVECLPNASLISNRCSADKTSRIVVERPSAATGAPSCGTKKPRDSARAPPPPPRLKAVAFLPLALLVGGRGTARVVTARLAAACLRACCFTNAANSATGTLMDLCVSKAFQKACTSSPESTSPDNSKPGEPSRMAETKPLNDTWTGRSASSALPTSRARQAHLPPDVLDTEGGNAFSNVAATLANKSSVASGQEAMVMSSSVARQSSALTRPMHASSASAQRTRNTSRRTKPPRSESSGESAASVDKFRRTRSNSWTLSFIGPNPDASNHCSQLPQPRSFNVASKAATAACSRSGEQLGGASTVPSATPSIRGSQGGSPPNSGGACCFMKRANSSMYTLRENSVSIARHKPRSSLSSKVFWRIASPGKLFRTMVVNASMLTMQSVCSK
mmetsp:Transcript_29537/g.84950  ORF Transcript_29537/g.84950 Transcript_29537/m.84950 type:complete len:414 (-) Transcript_29537:2267-3508(-)